MVSLANILLSVSTELVMVPTAYLTLAPMRFSEWISGKAFAFLMALSVVGGVGCGVGTGVGVGVAGATVGTGGSVGAGLACPQPPSSSAASSASAQILLWRMIVRISIYLA